jgi:hypothetical protein
MTSVRPIDGIDVGVRYRQDLGACALSLKA